MTSKEEYDNEPVEYCKNCLSLTVIEEDGILFCDKCGCMETDSCNIHDWERMYEERYHRKFIK